ncbi:flavin-containing monooxygenase [Cryptosporangium minutisporangium]|uniref:NAD(P)/FAD-dependent oxidoreductase n=1 Tax=Cryptosporangium minutisporangium TaxID=113569 RepID=A0ABP6SSI4_9ACTN
MAETCDNHDVVVIGAGFAGLYALHKLRGLGYDVHAVEAGSGVGGTWYWNRYPGARCDVDSIDYCYLFSPELHAEWTWTERYAGQPEILRYAEHVAERFDLLPLITFDTRVTGADFDSSTDRWTVRTDRGDEIRCRFLITAVGCLSAVRTPSLPGLDRFAGRIAHTGRWPRDGVDFTGARAGVVGTGSSGIQLIPRIAESADHLTVFQRTPHYSVPARNRPLSGRELRSAQQSYADAVQQALSTSGGYYMPPPDRSALADPPDARSARYERKWASGGMEILSTYNDLLLDPVANDTLAEFVRDKIRQIVTDPETAAALQPTSYPIGTKRICLDTDYYATYNRLDVTLVDLRVTPIEQVVETGVVTAGRLHELDVLVFATGYDAITGPLTGLGLRGTDGRALAEHWADGPQTLLGVAVAGFPNLFTITGPGSPSVLTNVIRSIEQHVDWIADCLEYLRVRGATRIEAETQAQEEWTAQVTYFADFTLYPRADSWYLGANIEGKPRQFMPYVAGLHTFRRACDEVAGAGYRGFRLG